MPEKLREHPEDKKALIRLFRNKLLNILILGSGIAFLGYFGKTICSNNYYFASNNYSTIQIEGKLFQKISEIIETSTKFYENLGLDPAKIRIQPSILIYKSALHTLINRNIIDEIQDSLADYISIPSMPIGQMNIRPSVYIKALLAHNNIGFSDNYEENLRSAIKNKLIQNEKKLISALLDLKGSLYAFRIILKMNIPPKNTDISISENIKNKMSFLFQKEPGRDISLTHEEKRLIIALAKFSGIK